MTTATDVYALGVLLYQLLAGRHPTALPTHTAVDRVRAVVEKEPMRVSDAAAKADYTAAHARATVAHKLARTLRGDLDNIAAKALKKQALERYPTVTALADDLRRYLDHKPVGARADSLAYRASKFVRRYRVAVGAASMTLLALIAGVIGTTWQAIEARRERDAAIFQAERALAKGNLVNLMLGAIGDADRPLTQREILERSVTLIEKQFTHDPRIAIDLLLPIAGQYFSLGDTGSDYAVMQRAGAIAAASADPALIADVACNTVEIELSRGRIDLAQAQLTTGKEALAKLRRPALGTTNACMLADADLARSQGDIDRAIVRISEAIDRAERAGLTRGNSYPKLLSFLAAVQHERGDLLASYDTQKKWQRLEEHSGRAGTVDYLNSRRAEAILLMALGEYIEAKSIIEAIVARWPSLSGNDSIPPRISQVRGVVMYTFGDLQGAERELAAAAARQRQQGGIQSALSIELALTRVLIDLGRTDDAERLLTSIEAAGSQRTMRPFITVPAVRAELLLARRALPQAAEVIDDEITAIGFPTVKASVPLASALRVAARVQLESGNTERAQQRAADALAVSERLARDPAKSADVGEALLLLAQAQRVNGQASASASTARRAAQSLAGGLGDAHSLTRTARALAGS